MSDPMSAAHQASSTPVAATDTAASTEAAIICAYQLDGTGSGTVLDKLPSPASDRAAGFYWLHLQSDTPESLTIMRKMGLSSAQIDALTAIETRPRASKLGDAVLIILRGVNNSPDADPEDMVSLRMLITTHGIISARKHFRRLHSVTRLRESIAAGQGPRTSSEFVLMLVTRLVNLINDIVDDIDEEITDIETRLTELPTNEVRPRLALVRRKTASLRRYLAPQRDALDTLYRMPDVLSEDDALHLREQTDRSVRYVEDLDLARERSLVLQEELRNQMAEQQNLRMYILSIVAAVFLPLSFLTGLFGMNVAGLPGTSDSQAFVYVSVSMLAVGVGLVLIMRWLKWI